MSRTRPAPTSRGVAITCLADWAGSGRPVRSFLDPLLEDPGLKSGDRQLAVMLVMGVLRRQQYLDVVLARFSKTPLRKMKPLTLAALRVGIYQLYFLERIPDSAAVNETVKVLKKKHQPGWLIRFVNGTLRAIARNRESLPSPETAGPDGGPLLEHPDWLTRRWAENFGRETMERICRTNLLPPQLSLQVNTARISCTELAALFTEAGMACRPDSWAADSLVLPDFRGPVTALPGFDRGFFWIQDQAAALAVQLCAHLQEQGSYLDGCAGLGGKTCGLARHLPPAASLTAVEPDSRRIRLLRENLDRLQDKDRVNTVQMSLQEFAAARPAPFDGILLDVPCSGTAVIRKNPDIRWNRTARDLPQMQQTQLELLRTAAGLLKPGGFLVYATCSLEPEENQQVIKEFLADSPGFTLTDCRPFLPEAAAPLVDKNGCFAPLPGEDIEGFFAARLLQTDN